MQTNAVTVRARGDVELDLAQVPRSIRDAGFRPANLRIRAIGRFERAGERVVFRIRGWTRTYDVEGAPAELPPGEVELELEVRGEPASRVVLVEPS